MRRDRAPAPGAKSSISSRYPAPKKLLPDPTGPTDLTASPARYRSSGRGDLERGRVVPCPAACQLQIRVQRHAFSAPPVGLAGSRCAAGCAIRPCVRPHASRRGGRTGRNDKVSWRIATCAPAAREPARRLQASRQTHESCGDQPCQTRPAADHVVIPSPPDASPCSSPWQRFLAVKAWARPARPAHPAHPAHLARTAATVRRARSPTTLTAPPPSVAPTVPR